MSKEYFLKMQEEQYNCLDHSKKVFLYHLGMEVKQIPTELELHDEKVKMYKKEIAKNYKGLNDYLFEKRNKI